MPIHEYSWAAGFDNSAGLVNIETLMTDSVTYSAPLPLGSVETITLDETLTIDGLQPVEWMFDYITYANFSALCTAIFGDLVTANADGTIRTRSATLAYANYNAKAHRPTGYGIRKGDVLTDVRFRFLVQGTAT